MTRPRKPPRMFIGVNCDCGQLVLTDNPSKVVAWKLKLLVSLRCNDCGRITELEPPA